MTTVRVKKGRFEMLNKDFFTSKSNCRVAAVQSNDTNLEFFRKQGDKNLLLFSKV